MPPVVRIDQVDVKNRIASFSWSAVPGATNYVLEIESTSTGTPLTEIVLDGAVASHRVTDMPAGVFFARVRARNDTSTSAAGNALQFIVPDMRDVIEALFLQQGPYAEPQPQRSVGVMLGWPERTVVRTRVAGLDDRHYSDIERSLEQVAEATNGAVRGIIVERLSDGNALVNRRDAGELQVVIDALAPMLCGNRHPPTCSDWTDSNGVLHAAAVIAVPHASGGLLMHEIGHALLGLGHIRLDALFWPGIPEPTMSYGDSGPVLTPMELDAVRMVYAAGLRGGAPRSAFYAAGLINSP